MFNVVVVVEWSNHGVVRSFYTVVVASIVVSNPALLHVVVVVSGVSTTETDPHVEVNPDHYEYANALDPFFSRTKSIPRSFDLFGKQGTGHTHGLFHVLILQRFLGLFGDFLFNDDFGFSFDASC